MAKTTLWLLALLVGMLNVAVAHVWLMRPFSHATETVVDDDHDNMSCPSWGVGRVTNVAPGQTIDVWYLRGERLGGFVRWAIAPLGDESHQAFDDNVFLLTCAESGQQCKPMLPDEPFALTEEGPTVCGDTITLPTWLKAGHYVLQWTVFGAGGRDGHLAWENHQYRACADLNFVVDGREKPPRCPQFRGGDRVSKLKSKEGDCWYFSSDPGAKDISNKLFTGRDEFVRSYYHFGIPLSGRNVSEY